MSTLGKEMYFLNTFKIHSPPQAKASAYAIDSSRAQQKIPALSYLTNQSQQ